MVNNYLDDCFWGTKGPTRFQDYLDIVEALFQTCELYNIKLNPDKTKLGEKAQILVERAVDMWSGNGGNKAGPAQGQGQGQVRVTQPITGSMASGVPMTAPPPPPQLTSNRAQMGMGMGNAMSGMVKDFNAMYSGGGPQQQQQQQNQQQQQMMDFEPMAANEAGWGNSSLF